MVLTIAPSNKVKKAEENDENRHIVSEALKEIAPGPHTVSKIARTEFVEPTKVRFLAKHCKDRL